MLAPQQAQGGRVGRRRALGALVTAGAETSDPPWQRADR